MGEFKEDVLADIPDDVLQRISFYMPWQYDESTGSYTGSNPGLAYSSERQDDDDVRILLQNHCWNRFNENPQLNTSVRGLVGRMTGLGFSVSSSNYEIQEVIEQEVKDFRNRLYANLPKHTGRAIIEGELFQLLTVHEDGFVEIDFVDPVTIDGSGMEGGIIYHPYKSNMPLIYGVKPSNTNKQNPAAVNEYWVPSIFLARDPEMIQFAQQAPYYNSDMLKFSRAKNPKKFSKLGGFNRFMICWDRGFSFRRSISYIRTVLEWLNHYENLKKYEIDHKKASGSYLWKFSFEDVKAFRLWVSLSDEEKRKTGIGAKFTPGGRIFLPPGMDCQPINPQLPKISDSDTDIMHMITAGLNEPEDVATGQSSGTFASVKASRGPMSDRVSDEISLFVNFLRYDLWGSIFFLRSTVTDFPEMFDREEVIGFDKQKPKKKKVKRRPEDLIDITFPTTEIVDWESRARAWLGVKHGSTNDTLGISNATIAAKMGIQNYGNERLKKANEDEMYPELIPTLDQEGMQEQQVAQGGKTAEPPAKPTVQKRPQAAKKE